MNMTMNPQHPVFPTPDRLVHVRFWIRLIVLAAVATSVRPVAAQRLVGTIDLPFGIYGARMCINPGTGRLYLPDAINSSIVVVDSRSNSVLYRLDGSSPVDAAFDPVEERVYISDGLGILVLDATNDRPLHRLYGPTFCQLTVDPTGRWIYAAKGEEVYVLDAEMENKNAVIDRIDAYDFFFSYSNNYDVYSLVNPVTRTVYFWLNNVGIVVKNLDSHEVIAVLPHDSSSNFPSAAIIDVELNQLYLVTETDVCVFDGTANQTLTSIRLTTSPLQGTTSRGIALDPVTHRVYVTGDTNAHSSQPHESPYLLTVIDGTRSKIAAQYSTGIRCSSLIVDPLTGLLYCTELWGDLYVFQDNAANPGGD